MQVEGCHSLHALRWGGDKERRAFALVPITGRNQCCAAARIEGPQQAPRPLVWPPAMLHCCTTRAVLPHCRAAPAPCPACSPAVQGLHRHCGGLRGLSGGLDCAGETGFCGQAVMSPLLPPCPAPPNPLLPRAQLTSHAGVTRHSRRHPVLLTAPLMQAACSHPRAWPVSCCLQSVVVFGFPYTPGERLGLHHTTTALA